MRRSNENWQQMRDLGSGPGARARSMACRSTLLGTAAILALAVAAAGAQASYPGRNGEIAVGKRDRFENYELWAVSPKTGRARPLTQSPQQCDNRSDTWVDEQPSYSASGRWIVYHHFDDCHGPTLDGIYKMRSDGSGKRLLLRPRGNTALDWPALSPSGRLLAWGALSGPEDAPSGTVYLAPVNRLRKRVALTGERTIDPAWSADGRLLASTYDVITRFDMTGSDVAMLNTDEGFGRAPDWSPDARSVAFLRDFGGERGQEAYVMGADGSAPRRFTRSGDVEGPVWSPDGKRMAFIRDNDFDGIGSLYVRPVGGGRSRLVHRLIDAERISWRPLR